MKGQAKPVRSTGRRTYIITEDLSVLVPRWCHQSSPPIPTDTLNAAFFEMLLERLGKALRDNMDADDGIKVITLQSSAFDDLLHKHDCQPGAIPREFWVSLDDIYPTPRDEDPSKYNLSITRYVNTSWQPIGHGPRPESCDRSLPTQVRECVNRVEEISRLCKTVLPVVLVDDGTFDGKTIKRVLDEFADQGVFIDSVRLGVAKRRGIDAIADWSATDKNGGIHTVPFIGASKLCPPIEEWVCERDFFPGVLYAGKVIAAREEGQLSAVRVGDHRTPVRAQYLYDWGEITGWASIPAQSVLPFTVSVLELCIELWRRLEELKGERILLRDLPAIPHKVYNNAAEAMNRVLDASWLDTLYDAHESLRRRL